jgi:hypothetical protein
VGEGPVGGVPFPAVFDPGTYRIRVAGRLGSEWADRFGGLEILVSDGGARGPVTEILARVPDQAALQGLLDQLYARGHVLLSVECLEGDPGAAASGGSRRESRDQTTEGG